MPMHPSPSADTTSPWPSVRVFMSVPSVVSSVWRTSSPSRYVDQDLCDVPEVMDRFVDRVPGDPVHRPDLGRRPVVDPGTSPTGVVEPVERPGQGVGRTTDLSGHHLSVLFVVALLEHPLLASHGGEVGTVFVTGLEDPGPLDQVDVADVAGVFERRPDTGAGVLPQVRDVDLGEESEVMQGQGPQLG